MNKKIVNSKPIFINLNLSYCICEQNHMQKICSLYYDLGSESFVDPFMLILP